MEYIKGETYLVVHNRPLELKTKADDSAVTVMTLTPGRGVYCKSYTHDDNNDTWIRTNSGWVRATCNNHVLIR